MNFFLFLPASDGYYNQLLFDIIPILNKKANIMAKDRRTMISRSTNRLDTNSSQIIHHVPVVTTTKFHRRKRILACFLGTCLRGEIVVNQFCLWL